MCCGQIKLLIFNMIPPSNGQSEPEMSDGEDDFSTLKAEVFRDVEEEL